MNPLIFISIFYAYAEKPGTCGVRDGVNYCGGKSKVSDCYCDNACVSYGDCCTDYSSVCSGSGGVSGNISISNVPQPPYDLQLTNAIHIDGTVKLSWFNVNGEAFYIYKNKNDGIFSFLAKTQDKFYKDTSGLSKDIKYGYYVTTVNNYGESLPSNKVYAYSTATSKQDVIDWINVHCS